MVAAWTKIAALIGGLACLTPCVAVAQTSGESQSPERALSQKAPPDSQKSERAMPRQTEDAGTPSAASERAMPSPDKK